MAWICAGVWFFLSALLLWLSCVLAKRADERSQKALIEHLKKNGS